MSDFKATVRSRLPNLGLPAERETEIVEELAHQLEDTWRSALDQGATEEQARQQALAQIPNWDDLAREIRAAQVPIVSHAPVRMAGFLDDLRQSVRTLGRDSGFTLTAVLALSLGIGANTAIFSAAAQVLLRPLPFPEPERIVTLWENNIKDGIERDDVSPANFLDWKQASASFDAMATSNPWSFDFIGESEPEKFRGALVSESYFDILRVQPTLGRLFTAADHRPGRNNAVLLSHGLWKRRFGGDHGVMGRALNLNGRPATVIGVLPPDLDLRLHGLAEEVIAPQVVSESWRLQRRATYLKVVARLKPAVSLEQARQEMSSIAARLARELPVENSGVGVTVVPLLEHLVGGVRPALVLLMGAAGMVLLIACVNVANLLLARGVHRQREFAIRMALGAGGMRLARQLLTEALPMAALGGLGGGLLAFWGLRIATVQLGADIPRLEEATLNTSVVFFAGALSLLTALGSALAPAVRVHRAQLQDQLKQGSRSASFGVQTLRTKSVLIVLEVAVTVVLLVACALLLRSFWKLLNSDPGFASERIAVLQQFIWRQYTTPGKRLIYGTQALENLGALPGVEVAGLVSATPLLESSMDSSYPAWVQGEPPPPPGQERTAFHTIATDGYFSSLRIPLLSGRTFRDNDRADSSRVVLINQTMARRFFGAADPVGRGIAVRYRHAPVVYEVVGVVGDVRHESLIDPPRAEFFQPFAQNPSGAIIFVVRSSLDPEFLMSSMKQAIWKIDPTFPFYRATTMETLVKESLAGRRMQTVLLGAFAFLALTLAAVGIYGVISFAVAQRTHEVGIRLALGARRASVIVMILADGLRLAAIGVGLGLALAAVASRALGSLLYETSTADPAIYAAIAALVIAVAAQACLAPAWRASRQDPLTALRTQ